MTARPRHVSATHLAARTGLTARWFTGQACEGRIPGAVQPSGPRGAWRFHEAKFWRWWDEREREQWQPSTGAAGNGGREPSETAENDGNLLERLLGLSLNDA